MPLPEQLEDATAQETMDFLEDLAAQVRSGQKKSFTLAESKRLMLLAYKWAEMFSFAARH